MNGKKLKDFNTILTELRRPFPESRVNFKVQSTKKDHTAALIVAYVDARDVIERLNDVCAEQWSDSAELISLDGKILGVQTTISIRTEDRVITRQDVGIGDDIESLQTNIGIKIHWSDSFKRAGVKFGIATSLYDLPQVWLNADKLYVSDGKIKGVAKEGTAELKKRYSRWLEQDAVKRKFGEVY
jgi:hypothetical protein